MPLLIRSQSKTSHVSTVQTGNVFLVLWNGRSSRFLGSRQRLGLRHAGERCLCGNNYCIQLHFWVLVGISSFRSRPFLLASAHFEVR